MANKAPFRLLKKLPGNKRRFKEVKVKNFFEIRTDNQGFICNRPGQKRDYVAIANDPSIYKVLAVGASVVAGYGTKSGEYTWPSLIETHLNENLHLLGGNYKEAMVINSAILGSEVAQDLRRFLDETIFLNPHIVLHLGGGGASYAYHGNPIDYYYHDIQKKMNDAFNRSLLFRQDIVLPNTFKAINRRLEKKDTEDRFPFRHNGYINKSAAELVVEKTNQFHAICSERNIGYHFFLQPGMGVGKKELTKTEKSQIQYFERYFFDLNWDEYIASVKQYAKELTELMVEDHHQSLLDVFEYEENAVYADPRHQNELGHKILADAIIRRAFKDNLRQLESSAA